MVKSASIRIEVGFGDGRRASGNGRGQCGGLKMTKIHYIFAWNSQNIKWNGSKQIVGKTGK